MKLPIDAKNSGKTMMPKKMMRAATIIMAPMIEIMREKRLMIFFSEVYFIIKRSIADIGIFKVKARPIATNSGEKYERKLVIKLMIELKLMAIKNSSTA